MNRIVFRRATFLAVACFCVTGSVALADRHKQVTPYAQLAPLARYMMSRNAEIAMARTAAPPAITHDARVLVLAAHGYETAERGTNGFTCLVERAWMSPFDHPEFWNWRNRSPVCYNAAASRTVLRYTLKRTDMVLAGVSKSAILREIKSAVAAKRLPTPQPGSIA